MSFFRDRHDKNLNIFFIYENMELFYIIVMSDKKTRELLQILRNHTGLVYRKSTGTESRFDYNFQGFHLPVVEPYLMSEGYLQKKYFWLYNFYDYSHLHDYCMEDILSGKNTVHNGNVFVIQYDKMTVSKLPKFIDQQIEYLQKSIMRFEQRKIEKALDAL